MKILIISDTSEYAIGHSFERALKTANHETMIFDLNAAIQQHIRLGKIGQKIHTFWPVETWIRKGNRDLATFAQRIQPEHIIVSGNAPILYSTLAFWKSIFPKVRLTLFWPDTLTNLQQTQFNCAPLYDQIASYSKATLPVFYQLGFKQGIWVPFAADPAFLGTAQLPVREDFEYDFAFIGGWRPERERAVLTVLKSFPALRIAVRGSYWDRQSKDTDIKKVLNSTSIYGKAFGAFLNASRINLNVIDDTNYPAANMRFFEIPGVRGLQLSSSCPEQENIFQQGKHIFYFKNQDDLCRQVKYILDNPEQATVVREAGYQLVTTAHIYKHRMEQLLYNQNIEP